MKIGRKSRTKVPNGKAEIKKPSGNQQSVISGQQSVVSSQYKAEG